MRNYETVNSDLYIKKSDLLKLEQGDEAKGYITVGNEKEYELVSQYAFQPSIKLDDNTYLVTFILK